MKWFKVHSEIKDDPKLLEMDDHQRWLWICVLALASEAEQRGIIAGVRIRGLAAALRTDEERLLAALALWSDLDMVDYDPAARTITICHWNERQYEKASDIPAATRDRKRMSRQSHSIVTPSHATDTDTDTETETDPETDPETEEKTTPADAAGVGVGVFSSSDTDLERGVVFAHWQENMPGKLTQGVTKEIDQMIAAYGPDEVIRAVTDACMANVRKPTYVRGILRRRANGESAPGQPDTEVARRRKFIREPEADTEAALRRKYVPAEYADIIIS